MALTMAGAVFATDLHQTPPISIGDPDSKLQDCTAEELQMLEDAGATTLWHFVLTNASASSGHLHAVFSDPADEQTVSEDSAQGGNIDFIVLNSSNTLESAETTDVSGDLLNLSHTCQVAPVVTPSPTPTPTTPATPTPTLPQTNTIDQSNTGGPGTSLTLVFALILAIAGGLVAYAMRPRRVGNR
jgi:hypothetical protein